MRSAAAALAIVIAIALGGSTAAALGPVSSPVPSPGPQDALSGIGGLPGSVLDGVLAPLGLGSQPDGGSRSSPTPGSTGAEALPSEPLAKKGAAPAANPFGRLSPDAFAAYATGTAYHQDASEGGADIELGFSGAVYSSAPLSPRSDEVGRAVAPALSAGAGFGRGSAVEVGLEAVGQDEIVPGDDNSDAVAPPNKGLVKKELRADLEPLADVDLLRSQASARAAASGCVLGSDLAYGMGSANKTDVADRGEQGPVLSLSADDPPEAVTQSITRARLTPPGPGARGFGLLAQTRQTVAPVTLFEGESEEFFVEVGGEWLLQATADGIKGSIQFGPDKTSAERPMLRLVRTKGDDDKKNDETLTEVDLAELFGDEGNNFGSPGIVEVYVGEDLRAIGGDDDSKPIVSGTLVAGAVDVVRVRIPDPEGGTLEVRVGHMEVAVAVPAGGITCPGIGMEKRSTPPTVKPGERFAWTVTLTNPNDCVLDKVKVVDAVRTTPGMRYDVVSASPKANRSGSTLTFEGIGPLRLGESKTVRIEVEVAEDSAPGRFTDEAVATGSCGPSPVSGQAEAATGVGAPVAMDGRIVLEAPEVTRSPVSAIAAETAVSRGPAVVLPKVETRPRAGQLARTGGLDRLAPACLLVTAGLLRRLSRRR